MAEVIDLKQYRDEPDVRTMGREALREALRDLQAQIRALDAKEPRQMDSLAYDDWAQEHEDLEDLMDEILDRLDELE